MTLDDLGGHTSGYEKLDVDILEMFIKDQAL